MAGGYAKPLPKRFAGDLARQPFEHPDRN